MQLHCSHPLSLSTEWLHQGKDLYMLLKLLKLDSKLLGIIQLNVSLRIQRLQE